MNESQWMASTDPAVMLAYLRGNPLDAGANLPPSYLERKLRLFACACARQAWHLMTDERSRRAVEMAERYAEGEVDLEELNRGWEAGADAVVNIASILTENPYGLEKGIAYAMSRDCCKVKGEVAARSVIELAARSLETRHLLPIYADLLREIIGDPFRPVTLPLGPAVKCKRCDGDGWVCTDDGWGARDTCKVCNGKGTVGLFGPCPWLAWNNGLVANLARAAYEERWRKCPGGCQPIRRANGQVEYVVYESAGPDSRWLTCPVCHGTGDGHLDPIRLAILADALEEAGCPEHEQCPDCLDESEYRIYCKTCEGSGRCGQIRNPLLAHLRGPGPHVRGCWVLDLLLGKE